MPTKIVKYTGDTDERIEDNAGVTIVDVGPNDRLEEVGASIADWLVSTKPDWEYYTGSKTVGNDSFTGVDGRSINPDSVETDRVGVVGDISTFSAPGSGVNLGVNSNGDIAQQTPDGTVTALPGGGSGSPGGSDTQLQYNNGGTLGGITGTTYDDQAAEFSALSDINATIQALQGIAFPNIIGTPSFSSHDHSEGGLMAIPNGGLANSSVTVTAGSGLAGGGAVSLGSSTTLDLALDIEDGGTDIGDGTFNGIDLGTDLSGTDNGDGTVTIDSTASGGSPVEVAEDGTSLTTDVTLIDVLGGLTASEPTADAIDLTVDESEVDHDTLLNFVANEHIDHSAVSISAGTALTGGGDLTATRTLNVDETAISHDNLSGFVAEEHTDSRQELIDSPNGHVNSSNLPDTEYVEVGQPVAASETLTVYRWGGFVISDDNQATGTALEVALLQQDGTVVQSATTDDSSSLSGITGASYSPAADEVVTLRVTNTTGEEVDSAGGVFGYKVA